MERIERLIKERRIKLSDCLYHTNRELENGGKIRILVLKEDGIMRCELVCPRCKKYSYIEREWEKPDKRRKVVVTVECPECGEKIKVKRMK